MSWMEYKIPDPDIFEALLQPDLWAEMRKAANPNPKPAPPPPVPDWCEGYQRDRRGNPLASAANIDFCLWQSPELFGLFWWELSARRVWIIGRLPTQGFTEPDMARPWTRDDLTAVLVHIQRRCYIPEARRDTVYWAIRKVAREHCFRVDDNEGGR